MTEHEAISIIKTAIAQVEWEYPMDYAAAFDMAIKALDNGWISVKDRLPDGNGDYLIYNGKNVTKGWFAGENGWIALRMGIRG